MKKMILVLVCVCITAFAFAGDFEMSIGGGIIGETIFGLEGNMTVEETILGNTIKTSTKSKNKSNLNFGAFFFFDATYVVGSLAYIYGYTQYEPTVDTYLNGSQVMGVQTTTKGSFHALELGLLGKYPFQLGERWKIFPLLGVSYILVLSGETRSGGDTDSWNTPSDANRLGFLGGVGADFLLTNSLFIRGEFLWGIWVPNKMERDAYKDGKVSIGNGPRLKLALGYTFR